jgi:hypothetical protein
MIQLVICLMICTQDLTGQGELSVVPGQRVRIRTECTKFYTDTSVGLARECPTYVGPFIAADSATIALMDVGEGAEIVVMRIAVRHFDLYRGTRSFGIGRGAGLGLIVGGLTGAVAAESHWGAPIGAVIGGLVGVLVKYESWQEIPLYDSSGRRIAGGSRLGPVLSLSF